MMLAIAGRELRSLFLSPLAWTVLAVTGFIHAWVFLIQVDTWVDQLQPAFAGQPEAPGVTDMIAAPLFATAAMLLLLVVPLLTMRLISEERRSGTLRLLQSSPVAVWQVVMGKFLAILALLTIMVGVVALMPLSLQIGTQLDLGKWLSGALGLWLLVGAFAAAGLYMSSLTRQPVIAAITTFGLLLLLWMIDWASPGAEDAPLVAYLSIIGHFQNLTRGQVALSDVAYYLLFMGLFLGLAMHRLDAERLKS
ncbi:ABC-2 type transport system permease protein [Natronospira proteinivora]|uniref:ABC-2 type transport system permease protein n=1 Tax=Natronospira proteinivora TaxID=1807133 RepID=A0ABT1GB59_9GAMM|nr:ABC transporter permease [Natronospira proteinivora]MCP1728548.1 ABC-2 type transport system permease protein [Natronospira proteinivora]